LSRVAKVLADLLTIKMIRSFRERPLRLFALGSLTSALLGLGFTVAAIIAAAYFRPEKVSAVVFPGAALLCFEMAGYLMLLGLIAETAVTEQRGDAAEPAPLARGDLR
jgi:hypothetical protein